MFFTAGLLSCADNARYFEDSGSVFHTVYHIKYKAEQPLTERITEEQEQTAADAVAESDGPTITKTS